MKVLLNKITSSTRNARLSREVMLGSNIVAEEGSVLAVRALDRKSTYNEVEDVHGRMATVNAVLIAVGDAAKYGDILFVAREEMAQGTIVETKQGRKNIWALTEAAE